jgi:FkbM family methyltransferase
MRQPLPYSSPASDSDAGVFGVTSQSRARKWLQIAVRWRLHGLMRRFAKRRMLEADRRLMLPDKLIIWARLSDTQGALLYVYGTTEFYGTSLVRRLIQNGDTVIDVGANLEEYTLLAAKHVGRKGRVLAFEPNPGTCELLSRSVTANGFDNVTLCRVALSDVTGHAYLENSNAANSGLARLAPQMTDESRNSPMLEVQRDRLDAIIEREHITHVAFVKLDVEGFEPAVLRGAERLLARDKPFVFWEVNDLTQSEYGFTAPSMEILLGTGYELDGVEPQRSESWRLVRLRAGESPLRFRDRWQHEGYQPNLLAAHTDNTRTQAIVERLLGARVSNTESYLARS